MIPSTPPALSAVRMPRNQESVATARESRTDVLPPVVADKGLNWGSKSIRQSWNFLKLLIVSC